MSTKKETAARKSDCLHLFKSASAFLPRRARRVSAFHCARNAIRRRLLPNCPCLVHWRYVHFAFAPRSLHFSTAQIRLLIYSVYTSLSQKTQAALFSSTGNNALSNRYPTEDQSNRSKPAKRPPYMSISFKQPLYGGLYSHVVRADPRFLCFTAQYL